MCRITAFYGADHKVGTTTISQAAAQLIAEQNKDLKVLFVILDGRMNNQFLKEEIKTIDDFKLQIESRFINSGDFARECRYKGNLFVLGGLANEAEERFYFPDGVKYLLEAVSEEFDLIICDVGERLDCGLTVGGLETAELRYTVLSQHEAALERYLKKAAICENLGFNFQKAVVNKFLETDSYSKSYLAERLDLSRERLIFVGGSAKGRQAEQEKKNLLEWNEESFTKGITEIANDILENCGLPLIKNQRKSRKWISFI